MVHRLERRVASDGCVCGRVRVREGEITGRSVIERRYLREVGGEVVQDSARIQVGELTDTRANDRLVSPWRPSHSDARLEHNLFDSRQDAVRAGIRDGVERQCCVMARLPEWNYWCPAAIGLADAARVTVSSECECQFEPGIHAILILEVQTDAIYRQRLGEGFGKLF